MPRTSSAKPGLTVFFPADNDSGTIASLVITARQSARRLTSRFEIIVVDEGSADATAQIADELQAAVLAAFASRQAAHGPIAERVCAEILSLPLHPALPPSAVAQLADAVAAFDHCA
jgi:dTDP-4-amino-4,6-dideoxygalactose transaminase